MNRYTPDGSAILDAKDNQYPVETAHPLPLPEGIEEEQFGYLRMLNFFDGDRWTNDMSPDSTHWLARRPLPEVPKVKTQEELDEEFINSEYDRFMCSRESFLSESRIIMRNAIAYARQCPSTPAQQQPAA